MKAERRHELQTNSLALWLLEAPDFFKRNAVRLLLGLVALILVVMLVRWYMQEDQRQAEYATARLSEVDRTMSVMKMAQRPITADETAEVPRSVQEVLEKVKVPQYRARALATLGDYYWLLATAGQVQADRQALDKAADSYKRVISDYPQQSVFVAKARLGLGAIEEELASEQDQKALATTYPSEPNDHWKAAAAQYEALKKDPNAPSVLKLLAEGRANNLSTAEKPVLVAPPAAPATAPSTQPAQTQPAATAPTGR